MPVTGVRCKYFKLPLALRLAVRIKYHMYDVALQTAQWQVLASRIVNLDREPTVLLVTSR